MRDLPRRKTREVSTLAESVLGLGLEVRQLRKARQMDLRALSEASGVSVSHLSAIELGSKQPSLRLIEAIACALDVTPDWFFARRPGGGPMEQACVVRARNRRDLNSLYGESVADLGYQDALLSSTIGGQFYMGIAVYPPRSERPEFGFQSHTGEEHGFVVEGQLELTLDGETILLNEGDSYSFDARTPHHARNVSDRECRLVWAVSPVVIPKDVKVRSTDRVERRKTN